MELHSPLQIADLLHLEDYARQRDEIRRNIIAIRKQRRFLVGDHFVFAFENKSTVKYQVQEVLRSEKIFEQQGIIEELETYNNQFTTATDVKCVFLIEYIDGAQRDKHLARMGNIEHSIALKFSGNEIKAIADEDLPRSDGKRTSAVHFLRFPVTAELLQALQMNQVEIDIAYPAPYGMTYSLSHQQCKYLLSDLGQ